MVYNIGYTKGNFMTTGIYLLYFNSGDETNVYVGQSNNIERRYKNEHISKLLHGTHENGLLQEAYSKYGKPELLLLEETTNDTLYTREIHWVSVYDSYNTGLNLSSGGEGFRSGHLHPDSLYPECTYLAILKLLAQGYRTQEVADSLQVSIYVVRSIKYREKHCYLAETHPELYTKATNTTQKRGPRTNSEVFCVTSPEGIKYTFTNTNSFAKEHKLDQSNLRKLVLKLKSSYKGWLLHSNS
jgi:hypothetical protein